MCEAAKYPQKDLSGKNVINQHKSRVNVKKHNLGKGSSIPSIPYI